MPGVDDVDGDAVVESLRAGVLAEVTAALALLVVVTEVPVPPPLLLSVMLTVLVLVALVFVVLLSPDVNEVLLFMTGEPRRPKSDLLGVVLIGVSGVSKSGSKGSFTASVVSFFV